MTSTLADRALIRLENAACDAAHAAGRAGGPGSPARVDDADWRTRVADCRAGLLCALGFPPMLLDPASGRLPADRPALDDDDTLYALLLSAISHDELDPLAVLLADGRGRRPVPGGRTAADCFDLALWEARLRADRIALTSARRERDEHLAGIWGALGRVAYERAAERIPPVESLHPLPAYRVPERSRALLAFERAWWRRHGAKERAIRERLGMSPTRYYQLLNALVDEPYAAVYDPATAGRLLRLRDMRRLAREGRGTVPAVVPEPAPQGVPS